MPTSLPVQSPEVRLLRPNSLTSVSLPFLDGHLTKQLYNTNV